jgi:hypothetical protein
MEKLSGLILDYYDDTSGEVLRAIEGSDELVKSAEVLGTEERSRLPDDTFALVLLDGTNSLQKFSMLDEGNTRLSIEYFLRTGHKLPEEAQKVAAENLLIGCGWYGIKTPPELEKIAIGALGLLGAGLVLPGVASEASGNLKAVRTAGGAIITPKQIKLIRMQTGV